jgi:hypothetical protein
MCTGMSARDQNRRVVVPKWVRMFCPQPEMVVATNRRVETKRDVTNQFRTRLVRGHGNTSVGQEKHR